jgi:uncharacterized protein YutD
MMERYGFRKDWSTERVAYILINGILQAWNSKSQVVGIFCDVAKAFDYVNHDILIEKLKVMLMCHTYCFHILTTNHGIMTHL